MHHQYVCAPSNCKNSVQEAQAAVSKAVEALAACQAALEAAEEKAAGAEGVDDEDAQDGGSLDMLRDDVSAAQQHRADAEAALTAASADVKDAHAAALCTWVKTQVYWTKGLKETVPGLLAAVDAGVPVCAVLKVSDPEHVAAADAPQAVDPPLASTLAAEHAQAAWDSPVLDIACFSVRVGPMGGRFVGAHLYKQGSGVEAASDAPVRGALELQAAFRELERCWSAHSKWRAQRKQYSMEASCTAGGTYANLMSSVPAEQQSVAVMLHCMLEQVACNVDGAPDSAEEGEALIKAAHLFDAALGSALHPEAGMHKSLLPYQYSTVLECDGVGRAARGVNSGYVQPPLGTGVQAPLLL